MTFKTRLVSSGQWMLPFSTCHAVFSYLMMLAISHFGVCSDTRFSTDLCCHFVLLLDVETLVISSEIFV